MSEWREMTLREAGVSLIDCEHRTPPAAEDGYPYIAIPQLKQGRLDLGAVRRISPENYVEWTRKASPQPYDVVLSRRCNPGETAYIPPDLKCALGQNLVLLRADGTKIFPPYLRWLARGLNWWEQVSKYINVGAIFDSLKCADIPNFQVPVPNLAEQQAIARILGDLDDKIELNRQINQTLEQIAQTIFKSWFVDFEPVKAKIEAKVEGRDPEHAAMCAISGKTDAELGQLPPEQRQQLAATAALFPDELVESELGLIPKGWEVKSLTEAIDVNPSRILKKGTIAPYLDMANVPTNAVRATNVIPREFSSGSKFMNGDTLLARITPCLENGKTAFVDFLKKNQVGWGSTEFIVFRPKAPLPEAFGYLLCRLPEFRAFAIANMSGTSGRQRVPNDCFESYFLAVPDSRVASAFEDIVGNLLRGIKEQDDESRTFATLRDTLLPKLLSGELSTGECK